MALFSYSNTTRFRMPPFENMSQDQDPRVVPHTRERVFCELGFVSSVIAAMCIQRYGIVNQTNIVANIAQIAVFVAGAWTCGENTAYLCYDLIFAQKYPNPALPTQPRRRGRRTRPAQRTGSD